MSGKNAFISTPETPKHTFVTTATCSAVPTHVPHRCHREEVGAARPPRRGPYLQPDETGESRVTMECLEAVCPCVRIESGHTSMPTVNVSALIASATKHKDAPSQDVARSVLLREAP